jgi:hypothetical protein
MQGVLLYMKYRAKYLSLWLVFSAIKILGSSYSSNTVNQCNSVITTFIPITVGQNLYTQYHKLLFPQGFDHDVIDCNASSFVFDLSVTSRYIQSRNASQIAQTLWGADSLLFQGADISLRSNNALVAEYFGMGPDTNGYITLCPRLSNSVIDFQLAVSGTKCWVQINLPVTYAKWSLTRNCGGPAMQGTYGTANLDGAEVVLNYPATAAGGASIAGQTFGTGAAPDIIYFYGPDTTTKNNSFIDAIAAGSFSNVDTDSPSIDKITVTLNTSNSPVNNNIDIGHINMGLYGTFDDGGVQKNMGVTSATFSTSNVPAAPDQIAALGGYTFGMVEKRNNNLFNFNLCGKWQLADIPIMMGYDFYKSDLTHLGAYLKFVIPTGTKIDNCLIKYVLNPVIGNGRHFELGIGLTGHANIWSCDSSSFGLYGDGYIDYMFGANQTRTFDLPSQPMSRYALVYSLTGDAIDGYSVNNTMSPVGDINLYEGKVTATRGEFMLDAIWTCQNWEIGLGYSFTGQTGERINCAPCGEIEKNNFYGLVGKTLQQTFGINVNGADINAATITFPTYDGTTKYPATNFFYLGGTDEIANVSAGQNSGYIYGDSVGLSDGAFLLPNLQCNSSGLMGAQVLNRIFGHIDYVWRDSVWQPEIGLVGSVGFVPAGKPTANYWDIGARIGFAF